MGYVTLRSRDLQREIQLQVPIGQRSMIYTVDHYADPLDATYANDWEDLFQPSASLWLHGYGHYVSRPAWL